MGEVVLEDEAVGADAEGGCGQAMVVDRTDLGVHQKRIAYSSTDDATWREVGVDQWVGHQEADGDAVLVSD
jgi:hypothetical protein